MDHVSRMESLSEPKRKEISELLKANTPISFTKAIAELEHELANTLNGT